MPSKSNPADLHSRSKLKEAAERFSAEVKGDAASLHGGHAALP